MVVRRRENKGNSWRLIKGERGSDRKDENREKEEVGGNERSAKKGRQ